MALWPFRRKSVRKRSRSGTAISDNEATPVSNQDDERIARTMSKKARTGPTKLQRRQRTYSFSPGRNDSIRFDRAGRLEQTQSGGPANQQAWERTPTLHPTRRKSSKRRRDDHDREAEIKAMSAFMPSRPAADLYAPPSSSKQSTKRAKTGRSSHHHRLPSQVSLPYPDSLISAMSLDSDSVAYRISALGSLAPRPTLKYAQNTRWSLSRAEAPATAELLKRPLGTRESNPDDLRDSRKRIDELANDLDAKDLRELMERDNRRRERRRQKDQERIEQKLACRAEHDRRDEAEGNESSKTSRAPEDSARDTTSQDPVGLGIEPVSSAPITSEKSDPHAFNSDDDQDGTRWETNDRAEAPSHGVDCTALHDPIRPTMAKPAEPEKTNLPSFSHGSRLVGILRSSKSRSKSTLDSDRDRGPTDADSGRKNSEASSRGASRLSLSSLLKWGSKSQRYSGPSSFSNTSREEMQSSTGQTLAQAEALARLQGEDPSNAAAFLATKSVVGAPKRTRSRFREDLPELPLSPPDSRVQSPEAEPPLPVLVEKSPELDPRQTPPPQHDTSPSIEQPSGAHSAEPHLSMSLASIDSEGSWLSGRMDSLRKPVKRDSLARAKRRETASSESATSSTHEELAITDDEYLSRLAPDRSSGFISLGRRSGEGRPSSDEESISGEAPRWGHVGAKPEVVQYHNHNRDTMRSQQGFLTIDSGEEDESYVLAPRRSE